MHWAVAVLLTTLTVGSSTRAASLERIRGILPAAQSQFEEGVLCISSDSYSQNASMIRVPAAKINDDYCDCRDGKDEPGTAACNEGQFWCVNAGFKGSKIPHAWVDDGHCDCCDGSDEPVGVCPNQCPEERESYLREARHTAAKIMNGVSVREKLIKEARTARTKDERRIATLKEKLAPLVSQLSDIDKLVETLRSVKTEIDSGFRALPAGADLPSDGSQVSDDPSSAASAPPSAYLSMDNGQDDQSHSDDHPDDDAVGTTAEPPILSGGGDALESQVNDWPQQSLPPTPMNHRSLNAATSDKAPVESGSIASEQKEDQNIDHLTAFIKRIDIARCVVLIARSGNPIIQSIQLSKALLAAKVQEILPEVLRKFLPSNSLQHQKVVTSCLEKAAILQTDLRKKASALEDEIRRLEGRTSRDPGGDEDALRTLEGKCIKGSFVQYEFELCPFDKVQQYEHGTMIARLGSWSGWEFDGKDRVMQYLNGDQCWNGPQRSVKVSITCGELHEIISVDEPNRCAYRMKITSPAVCRKRMAEGLLAGLDGDEKDEL